MVKKEDKKAEETQIDDIEAFEEFEAEEGLPEEEELTPSGKETQAATTQLEEEGPLDLSDLESPAEEPEVEEPEPKPESAEVVPVAEGESQIEAESFPESLLELAPEVPVNLVAVIGKTTTSVGDLMALRMGQVIDLGRPPGETVDVVVNGRLIARGELVDMDGQLGVRILKMVR